MAIPVDEQTSKPKPTKTGPKTPAPQHTAPFTDTSLTDVDYHQFAVAVLHELGAPTSEPNITFMLQWMNREGTSAAFNPLATTQGHAGAGDLAGNSAGVKNYATFNDGVQATVQTLTNGNYPGLVKALKTGTPQNVPGAELSKWSGGGYTSVTGTQATNGKVGTSPTSTVVTGSGDTTQLPPSTSYDKTALQKEFGAAAAFFGSDPSLQKVIDEAIKEGIDPTSQVGLDRFKQMVMATTWYKTTSAPVRLWEQLEKTDPASALQQRSQLGDRLGQIAHADGFTLDGTRQKQIAYDALKFGWSGEQINAAVAAEFHYNPSTGNPVADQVRQVASQYGLNLDDKSLATTVDSIVQGKTSLEQFASQAKSSYVYDPARPDPVADKVTKINKEWGIGLTPTDMAKWVTGITTGQQTLDQFNSYAQSQAISLHPWLKPIADSGVSLDQWSGQYKSLISGLLEVPQDSIDFSPGSKYADVLQQRNPDGSFSPMTLSQAARWARSQPEFQTTDQAKAGVATLATSFGKLLGFDS